MVEGFEIGPGGRIRTRTGSVLSGVPLLLGYTGDMMRKWCSRQDLHPHASVTVSMSSKPKPIRER